MTERGVQPPQIGPNNVPLCPPPQTPFSRYPHVGMGREKGAACHQSLCKCVLNNQNACFFLSIQQHVNIHWDALLYNCFLDHKNNTI